MQEFITYKNIKVVFSSKGKGNALVLLHGFLENSSMWTQISDELSKRNRVICIDLLGHGATGCLGYIHSMDEMAEVVKAVIKHLKLRRITLVGHSMGGYVALAFARKYVKNVKKLCLLNSTSKPDDEERKKLRLRAIKMAQTNYKSLVSMSITNLFAQDIRKQFSANIELARKEALKTSAKAYIACSEGMRQRKNSTDVLLLDTFEKLLIIGRKDPVLDAKVLIQEAKQTNTPFVELSGGHMSYIENSSELIAVLSDFI